MPHDRRRDGASGTSDIRRWLNEATTMATDNHTAPDNEGDTEELTEPAPESRTIQELIDAGYVGHVRGSDGGAMTNLNPPRMPEEAATRKWQ